VSSKRLTGVERELLKGLIRDGDHTYAEMAAAVGVSPAMVAYYKKRMGLTGDFSAPVPPPRPPATPTGPRGSSAGLFGEVPEWTAAALCAQTDPDAFFPERGDSTREAKRVCRGCPVRAECLALALRNGEQHGVWGGLTERQRRKLAASTAA
jgi:WhiB family redox-sensing transcriptional regulator